MVRHYKRKGPRPWRDRDKRMVAVVRLRAEGKSLRQIASELTVSHQTVANDLARWDAKQDAIPANVVTLSRKVSKSAVKSSPSGGGFRQPDLTPRSTATELRGSK